MIGKVTIRTDHSEGFLHDGGLPDRIRVRELVGIEPPVPAIYLVIAEFTWTEVVIGRHEHCHHANAVARLIAEHLGIEARVYDSTLPGVQPS